MLAEINYSFIYLFDVTSQIKLIYGGLPLGYDLKKTKECTYIHTYTYKDGIQIGILKCIKEQNNFIKRAKYFYMNFQLSFY